MSALKLRIEAVRHAAKNRAAGYVDAVMAAAVQLTDIHIWISREDFDRISVQFAGPCGPGCQLRRTLSWFVRDDGKCGCTEYAAEMDRDGPDGCEARIDEIVAHLVEQAAKKSVFLGAVPSAAILVVVQRAIAAARAEAAAATPVTPPPG
jgi:hypothetical protein